MAKESKKTASPATTAASNRPGCDLTVVVLVLWLHFYWSLVPTWDSSGYYGYGWIVAPAAFFFTWRRLGHLAEGREERPAHRATWPLAAGFTGFLVMMPLLRMVETGDPTWRPPFWIHAVLLAGLSHFGVAWKFGWKRSAYFLPVTVFALSAVPYPWQVEQGLIRTLTGGVIRISAELFNLAGRPVTAVGEKLESMGTMVEVTEGCSGIRSFQNLVMVALFFGELFRLHGFQRLVVIAVGIGAAVVFNTARAMTLARIRFDQGEEAFEAAHDNVGYVTFFFSAGVLLAVAKLLSEFSGERRMVLRTRTLAP
jgi:exosortase